jgi:hypothetical protein
VPSELRTITRGNHEGNLGTFKKGKEAMEGGAVS